MYLLLIFAVMFVSLSACESRDPALDEVLAWNGPYVLDRHIYYIHRNEGRVLVIDPRNSVAPLSQIVLEAEPLKDESGEFLHLLTFPDRNRIVFVSERHSRYYFINDANGHLEKIESDIPLEFDSFYFSPDGRWMVGCNRGIEDSYYEDEEEYYYFDNYAVENRRYDDNQESDTYYYRQGGENASGILRVADHYSFRNGKSIVANTHTLMVMSLGEDGAVSYPTLRKNDVAIDSVNFTGLFKICPNRDGCSMADAMEIERLVIFGDSRLWMLDPTGGGDADSDVIPLAIEGSYSTPVSVRVSANMADDTEGEGGIDDSEVLFVQLSGERDVVAINMLWDVSSGGLTYSINKLGLPFAASDILPYFDNGQLNLLVAGANDSVVSVNVNSSRTMALSLPFSCSRIYNYIDDAGKSTPVLYSGEGMVAVKTANLALLGEKNISSVRFGSSFSLENIYFTGTENRMGVAVSESGKVAGVELPQLTLDDVDAEIMELRESYERFIVDSEASQLYLFSTSYDEDSDSGILSKAFSLQLDNPVADQQMVSLGEDSGSFYFMAGDEKNDDLFVIINRQRSDGFLTAVSSDSRFSLTMGAYLIGDNVF